MWNLNDTDISSMKQEIDHLRTDGDKAGAEVWLVWAETYLNTLEVPGPPVPGLKKVCSLTVWLADELGVTVSDIYDALRESLPRILFQAKLAGRNDLSLDDGHTALWMVRSNFKEADG